MVQFVHPAADDITLPGVLAALADPVRLGIVRGMLAKTKTKASRKCMSCSEATPCASIPKSTLSNHFRILREAGLIRTVKEGVEHRSHLRLDEIEARFPGLLQSVLKHADPSKAA